MEKFINETIEYIKNKIAEAERTEKEIQINIKINYDYGEIEVEKTKKEIIPKEKIKNKYDTKQMKIA